MKEGSEAEGLTGTGLGLGREMEGSEEEARKGPGAVSGICGGRFPQG